MAATRVRGARAERRAGSTPVSPIFRASGGTGRRAGFRILCLRTCGFESHLAHLN